jgi:NADH-quinone oxidoreductase subunit L
MIIPYASWLVWGVPLGSSLLIPIFARIGNKYRTLFTIIASLITAVLAFSMIPDILSGNISGSSSLSWIPYLKLNVGVFVDSLSILFACLISFFGVIIVIYSIGYMEQEGLTRYYFLLFFFIGSMIGLVMADNFLQMFIFWEMVGFCSYALISFWYKKPESVKSGIKVFIMTRIGDIFLLAAICILYVNLGSFSFAYTIAHIGSLSLSTLTLVAFFILIGAIAKSAQLPLYTWLYAAMEAPTSISALLHAATMVKAGIYLIARVIMIFGALAVLIPNWLPTIAWIGVLTSVIGGLLAVSSPDIKGVQAYSTVSQLGLMMAALGTAATMASAGWFACLYQLINHAFFQGLNFLIIGGIIHVVDTRDMRQMGGLRKEMPWTHILAIIYLITAIGIPPLPTFFSKELIISSILSASNILGTQSITLGILVYASVALTFAYGFRYLILVFWGRKSAYLSHVHVHEQPKIMLITASILAGLCLVFEFVGPSLADFMHSSSQIVDEVGIGAFSNYIGIIIFGCVLFLGGYPIYLLYVKKSPTMIKVHNSSMLKGINHVLEKGLYFDLVYERVIAHGISVFSHNIYDYIEAKFLNQITQRVGHTLQAIAAKIKQWNSGSIQFAIIAFLLGLFLIILSLWL